MQYRVLGKTGLNVSILGYGASPLGNVFGQVSEPDGIRTVHTALDLGINFIDVSPYYGLTLAEQVLGKALKPIPRDRYVLATKVGRYGDASFDFSAARVTASVDESLARLGVDHIDLIQCHDIEFVGLDQIVQETLPALRRLQAQGKVGFVGITGLPLKIFETILAQVPVDTILSYCRYSLNDTSLAALIPTLQTMNVGTISASPLGMGLLTNQGTPDWHPAPAAIKAKCAEAAAFCRDQGTDIAKVALQYALSNPAIQTTLVGTASAENIVSNVQWLEAPADEALLSQVLSILAPIHNQTWQSGLPENN